MSKSYHFIGIGGVGMGALANILLKQGHKVTGSDLNKNQITEKLESKGADIKVGHASENIKNTDFVIVSSAIDPSNVELMEAKKQRVEILRRAELLAELMEGEVGITIAGAHGKTTTTAMISSLFLKADLKPTTAIGGVSLGSEGHAKLGDGDYFIAEVDESDGSFLNFHPSYSVITNIDFEHVDYFKTQEKLDQAYQEFIENTSNDGYVIACGDDERLKSMVELSQKRVILFGLLEDNDVRGVNISHDKMKTQFDCVIAKENKGTFETGLPGDHNILNALATIAVGWLFKIDMNVIKEALREFKGVQRRFQIKGEVDGVLVIDDYGHHPTEIAATLQAAQNLEYSRLITVFQPHRYTRTQVLIDEFAESLRNTDDLIVTDIYAASERPIEGVTAENLCAKIKEKKGDVVYLEKSLIIEHLKNYIRPGDLILTLGAGDIYHVGEELVDGLKNKRLAFQEILK